MIKKIIFDIDDTLIEFPRNFEIGFGKVLNKYNLNIEPIDLYNAIGKYEDDKNNVYYEKQRVIDWINKEFNVEINEDFINDFFEMYSTLITPVNDSVKETLKYLKSKYKLAILTNWFTDSQISRLKNTGIYEYFDEIYGADILPFKPNKETFIKACGKFKLEECVMIGDNLLVDIKVPYEMGMNVYHINKKGTSKYPTIRSIDELKELL